MHELALGLVHFSEYYDGPCFVIRHFVCTPCQLTSYAQSIAIKSVPYKHMPRLVKLILIAKEVLHGIPSTSLQ